MTNEYLPCPFFGGEGEYDNSDTSAHSWVKCNDCGAEVGDKKWNNRPAPPEGWKLVPIEPTLKMIDAAREATMRDFDCQLTGEYEAIHRAMLAASPQP
jgi:hypothetical protein